MIDIGLAVAEIQGRIHALSAKNETQSAPVKLVAVSKKQTDSAIVQAIEAGQRCFGENYLQEALPKIQSLSQHQLEWHYIGAIQSNKTRDIAGYFDWVHTVDRLKIAQRLSAQRPDGLKPLQILIQVNIDNDPDKAGISPGECVELAKQLMELPNIQLRGLMTILKAGQSDDDIRASYAQMKRLFDDMTKKLSQISFDTLSMGMSGDWPIAIEEGATLVRVGTAIFGARS